MPFLEIALILAAVAACGAIAVVTVYLLTVVLLIKWFRDRRDMLRKRNRVAVSLKKAKKQGRVSYIQGVLNEDTEEFDDVREIDAAEVEDKVRQAHKGNRIAVWT